MRLVLILILGVPWILAGCAPRGVQASPGVLRVVASFYPLAEAAERVGGDLAQVTDLTAPGVEPHDLELTPRQVEDIATADVLLYLGGGFQPGVEDAVGDATGQGIDVSDGLRTLPAPPGATQPGLEADPHVWLDPHGYAEIVAHVAAAFAAADASDASAFRSNAAAFEHQLTDLDRSYRQGLAHCERDVIVTSHAAFGYLAARYGLEQVPITGLSPEAEPGPQQLADLKALIERDGVTTIFTEPLASSAAAETLAAETGATTAVLDPIESVTPASAGQNYLSIMHANLQTLRSALGCS